MKRLLSLIILLVSVAYSQAVTFLQTVPPPPNAPNSPGPGTPDIPVDNILMLLSISVLMIVGYFANSYRLKKS